MTLYAFFELLFVPTVFICWIIYQLKFKKKKWEDVRSDASVIAMFIIISAIFYYWLFA